jgi:anaerobic dimethyl sulfoxide reductase subunit B (iron-sulfur subunit)
MHCEDAPCIDACPASAILRDADTDVVLVDQERCIGCKFCLWACPYGAPHFDGAGKMVKCDMCIERLGEGKPTACEAVCIARAIRVDKPEKIARIQAEKAVDRVKKEATV